jgi:hypothetical protein
MTITKQEEQLAKEIFLFLERKDLVMIFFSKRIEKLIYAIRRHPVARLIRQDRVILLTTYCIGQYLLKKSEKITKIYHNELHHCIDNKTFILKSVEYKKRIIPNNWNELWGLNRQNADQQQSSSLLPKV